MKHPWRILLCHNFYQYPGGEDVVFAAERDLLRGRGHEVIEFIESNQRIDGMSRPRLAIDTVWSRAARRRLADLLRRTRPDVVHFHNTFPLLSPSVYSACREAGVAVVQTLHNYRLVCPNSLFYRDGRPCEDCLGRTPPWPAVLHGCYRGSRSQTAVTAAMLTTHRLRRTWHRDVDVYIALTDFSRRKFIEGGLPAARIAVKPNFLEPDPGPKPPGGEAFLFAGRLAENKGVPTLLRAWNDGPDVPLRIAGDGPLAADVERAARAIPRISYLGRLDRPALLSEMKAARALVFPSTLYENFPVTIVEAFACGLPVIASRLGAMAEIVEDGRTGILFDPGDPADLAAKVRWAAENPDALARIGQEGRREFEAKYTGDRNYEQFLAIYERAIAASREHARPG